MEKSRALSSPIWSSRFSLSQTWIKTPISSSWFSPTISGTSLRFRWMWDRWCTISTGRVNGVTISPPEKRFCLGFTSCYPWAISSLLDFGSPFCTRSDWPCSASISSFSRFWFLKLWISSVKPKINRTSSALVALTVGVCCSISSISWKESRSSHWLFWSELDGRFEA